MSNRMVAAEKPYTIATVTTKALEALQGIATRAPEIIFELTPPIYNTKSNMYERRVCISNKNTGNCSVIDTFRTSSTVPNDLLLMAQDNDFQGKVEEVTCNLTKSK